MTNGKVARDYMSPAICLPIGTQNAEVIRMMLESGSRVVLCVDVNLHVKGIVSGTDYIREIDRDVTSSRIINGNIENLMSPDLRYVTEDTIMVEVVEKMNRYHLQSIVVMRGMEPKGVINQLDLLRWWHDEFGVQ